MLVITNNIMEIAGIKVPGMVKSVEVTEGAVIDDVTDDNNKVLGNQPNGYDPAKISVEVTLEMTGDATVYEQTAALQALFKPAGQTEPKVMEIINDITTAMNISKVYFKSLYVKDTISKSSKAVTIEFIEDKPITVAAKKKSTKKDNKKPSSSAAAQNLTSEYQEYLNTQRGKAPAIKDKTKSTPAKDDFRVKRTGQQ